MQTALLFELQCFPDPNFLYNSRSKPTQSPCFSLKQSSFSKPSRNIQESLCHPHKFSSQIHVQRPVVSALRRKRRSGSARSTKILLESAYLVATKLKIFPEPIELLIREFCGGNGGGGLSLKGYGGGEGSGGWRKRRKVNWVVLGSLVILGIALSLAVWKEYDQEMVFGVAGLSLIGLSVNVWKRGVLDWVLGFCCCAALGGFLLKGDLQRGVKFLGTMKISRRRKRRWF
nr:uncharacterized protein LOC109181257 [Ipomoea batatas]